LTGRPEMVVNEAARSAGFSAVFTASLYGAGMRRDSVDDFAVGDLVVEPLEVWQLESANGANCRVERLARRPLPFAAERAAQRPQRP
jgi:hypothetical protein